MDKKIKTDTKVLDIKRVLERIPMLTVYKEGDIIRLKTTRNITNYELYGFLKTYIQFLKTELLDDMASYKDNYDKDDGNDAEFI